MGLGAVSEPVCQTTRIATRSEWKDTLILSKSCEPIESVMFVLQVKRGMSWANFPCGTVVDKSTQSCHQVSTTSVLLAGSQTAPCKQSLEHSKAASWVSADWGDVGDVCAPRLCAFRLALRRSLRSGSAGNTLRTFIGHQMMSARML